MDTKGAYDQWAATYDTDLNITLDLELYAGQQILKNADFTNILEIGCGTGKNTGWLSKKASEITAVDFSEEMLKVAEQKIKSDHVYFKQADITKPWDFNKVSLIIASLVLEHIENIDFIFEQAASTLIENGCFYICELHPYKQMEGSRAKFEKNKEWIHLEYFVHHISDFFSAAAKNNLHCIDLNEWFDDDNRKNTPRLVSFLFQKKA